jgi:hypothetical protein
MDGVKTVPVQAITALLYTASGLAGLYAFLKGHYYFSFFLSLIITQMWRFSSEFFRADFRGKGSISAYQVMSLFIIPYYIIYFMLTGISELSCPGVSIRAEIRLESGYNPFHDYNVDRLRYVHGHKQCYILHCNHLCK